MRVYFTDDFMTFFCFCNIFKCFLSLSWNALSISGRTEIVSFGIGSVNLIILVSLNTFGWSFLTIVRASWNTAAASTSPLSNEMTAWSCP